MRELAVLGALLLGGVVAPLGATPPARPVSATPSPCTTAVALDPDRVSFHPATASSARTFLTLFWAYTGEIEEGVRRLSGGSIAGKSFATLSSLAKRVRRQHTEAYGEAISAATNHLMEFKRLLGAKVDRRSTYLVVHKSAYVVYLVDGASGLAWAAFPIAHGVKSVVGPKERRGDLKTPESAAGERSPATTPFFAHPLIPVDPYPTEGCITRGIGVASRDPRYDYLHHGWTVMLHGTPDRQCIGTRASHGCIRLLPAHIEVLFDHVTDGTKIVIVP